MFIISKKRNKLFFSKGMKNKKLIGFLIVLIFLAVLIVVNSTLFTLQKINVNWLTSKCNITMKDYDLIEDVKMGESIFLINKSKITDALESKEPYLRVVSIETKFPNKLVIHSAERESLYAIHISDDDYAVVDEMGKVLERCNSSIFAGSEIEVKPIKVYLDDFVNIVATDLQAGQMIKNDFVVNVLKQISKSLRESNYQPTTSKGVFTSLQIINNGDDVELLFKTRCGLNIDIKNAMKSTTDMLLLGLERYNAFYKDGVIRGSVVVEYNEVLDTPISRYSSESA